MAAPAPRFSAHVSVDRTTPAELDQYGKTKVEREHVRLVELNVVADSYEALVAKLATILPNA
jgi:hypothetical protein